MIIWLASYPRSGNTLLRTICKHCFNIYSYADEPINRESEFRSNPELIGHQEYKGNWQDFYQQASQSEKFFLIKTHLPPIDNQPFIYIVRDGRSAIKSYKKFFKNYNNKQVSLVRLILGGDAYSSWSEHYYQWNNRKSDNSLLLKFEDLIDITEETLSRIASFINYQGTINKWQNPLDQLKTMEPNFFSADEPAAADDVTWTSSHEYLFVKIHGELMTHLNYYEKNIETNNFYNFQDHIEPFLDDLLDFIGNLLHEKEALTATSEERLMLINKLQGICEERLGLINLLNDHIKKQL